MASARSPTPSPRPTRTAAQRAAVANELRRRGYGWTDARQRATEAIPDPGDVGAAADDGVTLGADLTDTPIVATVARGLAFAGKIGFVHGPKASGKTTILAAAAAAVTKGAPFAGAPTRGGFVLVVKDDDPGTWAIRMRQFGADAKRWGSVSALQASRPGQLARIIAKYEPAWIVVDNLSKWCRALDVDVDSSSGAERAADTLTQAVRESAVQPAMTIAHNEARSKETGTGYANRMRNSTVFEDAADWIVGCQFDGYRTTTVKSGEKSRVGIPTETMSVQLEDDGSTVPGAPPDFDGGGAGQKGGGQPFGEDDVEHAEGWLMDNPRGSQNSYVHFAKSDGRTLPHQHLREAFKVARDRRDNCDARGGASRRHDRDGNCDTPVITGLSQRHDRDRCDNPPTLSQRHSVTVETRQPESRSGGANREMCGKCHERPVTQPFVGMCDACFKSWRAPLSDDAPQRSVGCDLFDALKAWRDGTAPVSIDAVMEAINRLPSDGSWKDGLDADTIDAVYEAAGEYEYQLKRRAQVGKDPRWTCAGCGVAVAPGDVTCGACFEKFGLQEVHDAAIARWEAEHAAATVH